MRFHTACILALNIAALAHPGPAMSQDIDAYLQALGGDQPSERASAFYALLGGETADVPASIRNLFSRYPAERERISNGLIQLLASESTRLTLDPPMMTESDGAYIGDLIWAVASLRHPGAASALLPVIRTGRVAIEGLADLGDAAVAGVVERSQAASPGMRRAATTTLGVIAERRAANSLSAHSMSVIRTSLLRSMQDDDPGVRAAAVKSMMHYSDDEVRSAIARLAASDPHKVTRGGRDLYTVREAAKDWLQKHRAR